MANLETDQQLSVLLAIEAVQRTRSTDGSVLRESEEALHRAVTASRIVTSIPGSHDYDAPSEFPAAIDWGPAGLFVMAGVFASEGPRPVGIVDLRDQATGEIVRSLPGHDGKLTGAAFSSDGSMLATTGEDGLLKVWDLSSGDLVTSPVGTHGMARGPSFSADGSRVAAAFGPLNEPDGVLLVVDLNTDELLTLPAPPWANDVSISPDGRRIAAVGGSLGQGDIHLIDVETAEVHRIPATPVGNAFLSIAWSPDGRHIAAGGWSSEVP